MKRMMLLGVLLVGACGGMDSGPMPEPQIDPAMAAAPARAAESVPDVLESSYEERIATHTGPWWDGLQTCVNELCAAVHGDDVQYDACKRACLALCSQGGC